MTYLRRRAGCVCVCVVVDALVVALDMLYSKTNGKVRQHRWFACEGGGY